MRAQEIIDKIKDLLDSNLSDPNSNRSSSWIYTDFPRLDASKPRIGIEFVDDTREFLSVNSINKLISARIQVTILLNTNNKFDIDNDGEAEKCEDVLNYLGSEVEGVIKDNQDQLRAMEGVYHVLPETSNQTSPDEKVKQLNIDFRAVFRR